MVSLVIAEPIFGEVLEDVFERLLADLAHRPWGQLQLIAVALH